MYNLLRETISARITDKSVYNAGEAVIKEGTAVFADTSKSGLYNIKESDGEMYFTVPFPEEESDVLQEAVVTGNKAAKGPGGKLSGNMSRKMVVFPVLFLLLVLLMAEWRIYRKRL